MAHTRTCSHICVVHACDLHVSHAIDHAHDVNNVAAAAFFKLQIRPDAQNIVGKERKCLSQTLLMTCNDTATVVKTHGWPLLIG